MLAGFHFGQAPRAALNGLALDSATLEHNHNNQNYTVQDHSFTVDNYTVDLTSQINLGTTIYTTTQNKKHFKDDLLAFPFDLGNADALTTGAKELGVMLASQSMESSPSVTAFDTTAVMAFVDSNAVVMDRKLQSPLGLDDSPFSEFFASPMFEADSAAEVPPLDYPSLFPAPVPSNAPKTSTIVSPTLPATSGLPLLPAASSALPSPAFSIASLPTSIAPSPFVSPAFAAISLDAAPAPVSSSSSGRAKSATGFRGASTPLVALDAPIQPRQYSMPSSTSRKRKTVAVERELAKRGRPSLTKAADSPVAAAEEIPSDLVAAVERKRLQNTLSARKSRARKQERLAELETENEALKARVQELEAMLGFKPIA